MKSPDFREKTAEWINEAKREDKWWSRGKRPVCMIVGVLLCEDVDLYVDINEEEKRVTEGEIALGTVAEIVAGSQGIPVISGGVGNASAVPAWSSLPSRHSCPTTGKLPISWPSSPWRRLLSAICCYRSH